MVAWGPADYRRQRLAHDALDFARLDETGLDLGGVDSVADLVRDFANELAEIAEVEIAPVFFFDLLLRADMMMLGFLAKDIAKAGVEGSNTFARSSITELYRDFGIGPGGSFRRARRGDADPQMQ